MDRPSALPGGEVVARGAGCPPSSLVTFRIDGRLVGSTMADGIGAFVTRLRLPVLPLSRYLLTADCGGIRLESPLDIVITTSSSGSSAAEAAAAGAVLLLFLLILQLLTEGRDTGVPPPHVRVPATAEPPG